MGSMCVERVSLLLSMSGVCAGCLQSRLYVGIPIDQERVRTTRLHFHAGLQYLATRYYIYRVVRWVVKFPYGFISLALAVYEPDRILIVHFK